MLQQFGKLLFVGKALASRDGYRAAARYLHHRRDIGVRHRLLEPCRPELVDGFGELDRGRHIKPAVALDQQVDRWTDGVAHSSDDIDGKVKIAARQGPPARAKRIEFEGGVSPAGNFLSLFRET